MHFSPHAWGLLVAAALPLAAGSPVAAVVDTVEARANPTIFLCGDSTMAARGANDGATDGWGAYFGRYATTAVVNRAIGGRSARSFTDEGRFQAVANEVKAGDIVLIEFGHNDGGSPRSNDNGRSACPGSGTETCVSDKTGQTVYTFPFYIVQAARLLTGRGATVVLSTQTPNNLWEGGTYYGGAGPRFVDLMAYAHRALAMPDRIGFVDHYQAVANTYRRLGNQATNALYPRDHTHTSPQGADLVAQAFAQAIATQMNGTTTLRSYIQPNAPRPYRF